MTNILLVIDMQNDFVTGSLGTPEAQEIVPYVKSLIEEYEDENNIVAYTRDTHFPDYLDTLEGKKLPVEHCLYETSGWCIIDDLQPTNGHILNKKTFGATDLVNYVRDIHNIDTIQLCGVCTDICIVSNALLLRAAFPNTRIVVDAKACAGTTPEKHKAALEVMKSCQIDVINE